MERLPARLSIMKAQLSLRLKTQPPLRAYILRIAIRRNRWHLHLHDAKTGQVLVFDSFGVLRGFLESGISNHPPDG